jgi:hypothetical protein
MPAEVYSPSVTRKTVVRPDRLSLISTAIRPMPREPRGSSSRGFQPARIARPHALRSIWAGTDLSGPGTGPGRATTGRLAYILRNRRRASSGSGQHALATAAGGVLHVVRSSSCLPHPAAMVKPSLRRPDDRWSTHVRLSRYSLGPGRSPLVGETSPGERDDRHGMHGEYP